MPVGVDHVAEHGGDPPFDVGGVQRGEHGLADVDTGHVVTASSQWDRQPAGAHGELEDLRRMSGDE